MKQDRTFSSLCLEATVAVNSMHLFRRMLQRDHREQGLAGDVQFRKKGGNVGHLVSWLGGYPDMATG